MKTCCVCNWVKHYSKSVHTHAANKGAKKLCAENPVHQYSLSNCEFDLCACTYAFDCNHLLNMAHYSIGVHKWRQRNVGAARLTCENTPKHAQIACNLKNSIIALLLEKPSQHTLNVHESFICMSGGDSSQHMIFSY